ncbi:MAG TPA: SDR family oxidoreductase [Caulobacteraceae bacterium]|nr:SDR family oxidoreductase [Caulobacteraceae bacterium]
MTAAAAGIGRATVLAFVREGAQVIGADIDVAGLATLMQQAPGLATQVLDATDGAALDALSEDLAAMDVVVNAVGVVPHGAILDCSDDEWRRTFEINVGSMHKVISRVLPGMLSRGTGSIVNIASVVSSLKGAPNRYAYGASKGAVIGLTKAIAADYVARGVRCNAICPGTIDTPSLAGRIAAAADPVEARKAFIGRQPMGRLGTADEIASMAVYLASDESVFVTGAAMIIDGGWSA